MRGWWLYALVAALSLAGCFTVPPLGAAGWALLFVLYFMAQRQEAQDARIAELEAQRERDSEPPNA